MAEFSLYSCYAALSTCAGETPLYAFLKMVVALVDKKKYKTLEAQDMVSDFFEEFKFKLPYHPMQTIINLGIAKGYFEYNSSLKKALPVWEAIDSGEFMEVLSRKEAEYKELLRKFGEYLQRNHSMYCSEEDLSDRVQAFIQRYGLVTKVDKSILARVKTDYYFAEYLLYCQENGDTELLEYIDAYITGCAFEELLTFSEPMEQYKTCSAKVYLDTGFVFALLGIESKDRSANFKELLKDMIHLGMKPRIFSHTYSEISGIIDTAIQWIGNPNYNPAIASETAYCFVTNRWSYQDAIELLGDLKRKITEDFQIQIDDTPYPGVENIRTKHQETIKQMIVGQYTHNNPNFSATEKDYTIEQDSRSLFMTLHFNGDYVAHTLTDLKNVFVTTNRSLARVGRELTSELVRDARTYIPLALNDLAWGTLIWSNSPAKISTFNKASIISAAFAAFQPSDAVLKKLNKTLIECLEKGEISSEKCYFLKTNALALRILAQKTQNDEERYTDQLPYEILREFKEEGFQEGLHEKQKEVDQLIAEREAAAIQRRVDDQNALIRRLKEKKEEQEKLLNSEKEKKTLIERQITLIEDSKKKADRKIKRRCKLFNCILAGLCLVFGIIACRLSKSTEYNWIVTAIGAVFPYIAALIYSLIGFETTSINVIKAAKENITSKTYAEYGIDLAAIEKLKKELENQENAVKAAQDEYKRTLEELKRESLKVDEHSIDINLVIDD